MVYTTALFSQNKQVLYDFAELPQTLLLNPASETNDRFHIGIPLLSGFSTQVGSSGVVLTDLFAVDNQNFNDKVSTVLNSLTTNDFIQFNAQLELLNAGFRFDEKTYISFGFYQEIDAIGYYPKDVFIFFSEGNDAYLNKSFSASQILYKLDVLGAIHVGITKKITDKVTFGGRFKIYSSALNIESTNNTGTFTTTQGTNNQLIHYFRNVNIESRTAGLIGSDREFITEPNDYLKATLFSGNIGVGFDAGVTLHISPQLQFSGSILDVGFINYTKNTDNIKANGNFIFEGINFEFDPNTNIDYWTQLSDRFKEQIPTTETQESYISWRPAKINMVLKYSFGEKRSEVCYDDTYKDFFTDAIGAQLFTVFRPLHPQLALTTFYQKSFSKKLHAKVTYTFDNFSSSNIGFGISQQIGKLNVYGMFDNLLNYRNLSSANAVSLQFGMNLIFN